MRPTRLRTTRRAAVATGELLWFLNDDVEPAGPDVLGHMVGRLLDDEAIGAVGARLIYPRRPGRRYGSPDQPADLSLQHRGVTFTSEAGRIGARNLGKGEDPFGPMAGTPSDVPAATAASLLVRRSAYEAVGGFAEGYDYGAEDVDLCVRLRRAGHASSTSPRASSGTTSPRRSGPSTTRPASSGGAPTGGTSTTCGGRSSSARSCSTGSTPAARGPRRCTSGSR